MHPQPKPTQPSKLSAAHLSAGTSGRHRFPPQGLIIGSCCRSWRPAHLCRGCQLVFPFRRERTVLLQVRWRNMERSLAKEKGDVYLDTYQTAPWNARLFYRMVLNDPMLSVSIHLKPANRPEKIKWRSISGPILVISISKRGNTSTWEIPLKDGHQNRSKSVVLVAESSFSSASGWSSLRSCQVSQVKPGAEVWERGHAKSFQSVFNQLPRFGDQKQKLSHYPLPSGNST